MIMMLSHTHALEYIMIARANFSLVVVHQEPKGISHARTYLRQEQGANANAKTQP